MKHRTFRFQLLEDCVVVHWRHDFCVQMFSIKCSPAGVPLWVLGEVMESHSDSDLQVLTLGLVGHEFNFTSCASDTTYETADATWRLDVALRWMFFGCSLKLSLLSHVIPRHVLDVTSLSNVVSDHQTDQVVSLSLNAHKTSSRAVLTLFMSVAVIHIVQTLA